MDQDLVTQLIDLRNIAKKNGWSDAVLYLERRINSEARGIFPTIQFDEPLDQTMAQSIRLLEDGLTLDAIKHLRKNTGFSLVDSKNVIVMLREELRLTPRCPVVSGEND